MPTRRQFLAVAAGSAAAALCADADEAPRYTRGVGLPVDVPGHTGTGRVVNVRLTAAERPTSLPCFQGQVLPMWTFTDGTWPPVIRLKLGDRLDATLENRLSRTDESTSIHWHGIRLPNSQDGVPYLVQPPVPPGGSFAYSFIPPDPGTYFFHTHCNTVEQLGRGLEGILIVDGDTTEPYDADTTLLLRDWRLDPGANEFDPFYTLRGAGRAGSYGALRSVNGAVNPAVFVPSKGDCRIRIINSDPTRVMQIGIAGADAAVLAIDGIAVAPFAMQPMALGPAMRIDLVLRAPAAGGIARLIDFSGGDRVELAHFVADGPAKRSGSFDPAPLRAGHIPEPDLKTAARFEFAFDASEAAQMLVVDEIVGPAIAPLCLSERIFWTINGRPWPDRKHAQLPPPLAMLDVGRSYVFELTNKSSFAHPIHIHGHTFKVVRQSKQRLPQHHADTVLLLPEERAEVAFVADNPGSWMLHCHVIEHQESGMMGYFRVA